MKYGDLSAELKEVLDKHHIDASFSRDGDFLILRTADYLDHDALTDVLYVCDIAYIEGKGSDALEISWNVDTVG